MNVELNLCPGAFLFHMVSEVGSFTKTLKCFPHNPEVTWEAQGGKVPKAATSDKDRETALWIKYGANCNRPDKYSSSPQRASESTAGFVG